MVNLNHTAFPTIGNNVYKTWQEGDNRALNGPTGKKSLLVVGLYAEVLISSIARVSGRIGIMGDLR